MYIITDFEPKVYYIPITNKFVLGRESFVDKTYFKRKTVNHSTGSTTLHSQEKNQANEIT